MRHRKLRGQLGVSNSHRKAMLRNLLLSLLRHERIRTTMARAKQLKRYVDHVIELGKQTEWQARRRVRQSVQDKEALKKIFSLYGPRFKGRQGGYTRIFKLGIRRGDAAHMGLIEILPDPSKENDPRIIKVRRTEDGAETSSQQKKSKRDKKKDTETMGVERKKSSARAEAEAARQHEDVVHSHKSQGRKTDKGTGRSKSTKKGIS